MNKIFFVFLAFISLLITQKTFAALTISNGVASNDSTLTNYQYNYTGTPLYFRVYIDSDKVASTGYPHTGIGADYLIENKILYKYAGTSGSWKWTQIGAIASGSNTSGIVKYSITLTSIGETLNAGDSADLVYEIGNSSTNKTLAKFTQTYTGITPTPTPDPTPTPTPTPVPDAGKKAAWTQLSNYACYYGDYNIKLKDFQAVIIESTNMTADQIKTINQAGAYTICYISIGEEDTLSKGDGKGPGGYASYYIDNGSGQPAKNTNWNSYYVDAGNPTWQDKVINQLAKTVLVDKACDGIFMDTVETPDLYPQTKTGMISLVHNLHVKYPNAKLVSNRGFSMLTDLAPNISGLMFENFQSDYNFNTKKYISFTTTQMKWPITQMVQNVNEIRKTNYFPVFGLDYALATSTATIQKYYDLMWEYDMVPYVSDINLSKIYNTVTPTTVKGSKAHQMP